MTALDDLLAIQDLDTMLDQLRHRRATLPELAALAQLAQDAATVGATRDEVAGRLNAVRSAQKEAEDHASLLEDKAREVNTSIAISATPSNANPIHKPVPSTTINRAMSPTATTMSLSPW